MGSTERSHDDYVESIRKSTSTPVLRYINAMVWLHCPKFICWWNLIPNAVISAAETGKRGGYEHNDRWSLRKRPTKTCLLLHLQEGSASRCQLWIRECAPSFHTSASGALILGFAQCTSVVYKSPSLWHFCYDSLNRLKTLAREAEHIYAKALRGYCARLVENVWPT